jgi:hypothetical protein
MTQRTWTDNLGSTYREREDGRIIMEWNGEQTTLGAVWVGDDFDRNPQYRRVTSEQSDESRVRP